MRNDISSVIAVFFVGAAVQRTIAVTPENCIGPPEIKPARDVYYGWPVYLSCNDLLRSAFYADYVYESYDFSPITCVITALPDGDVLLNHSTTLEYEDEDFNNPDTDEYTYTLEVVTIKTSDSFKLVVYSQGNWSICKSRIVNLNATKFVQETCNKSLIAGEVDHDVEKEEGDSGTELQCEVPRNFDGPYELIQNDKADIHWLFNCETDLPGNVRKSSTQTLQMNNISYEANPGVYSCVVKFRGQTRYRIHHKLCVRDKISRQLSPTCPDFRAEVGKDFDAQCEVDAGVGHENVLAFQMKVLKLDGPGSLEAAELNNSCDAFVNKNDTISDVNERFSCNMTLTKHGSVTCFYKPPTADEYQKQKTSLEIHYKIKNVQESDFGEYVAKIVRYGTKYNVTFKLEKDSEGEVQKRAITIGVTVSVLFVILVIILVLILFRVEIRWAWRRKFGTMEKEIKKYVGYLAYYYSNDMKETSAVDLDKFVETLETRIKRMGGNLYDKCRDHTAMEHKVTNIQARLSECHRVVIIMTPEYIRDQWSVQEAYQAWQNVIENRIPIIFVTFPTTASAIKNMESELKIALNKALKRHRVIKWNGKFPFTKRMKKRLELAMPKLPLGGELPLDGVYKNPQAEIELNGYGHAIHENAV